MHDFIQELVVQMRNFQPHPPSPRTLEIDNRAFNEYINYVQQNFPEVITEVSKQVRALHV